MKVFLKDSRLASKRYTVEIQYIDGVKRVSFGQKGAKTFIDHQDEILKKAYIARHSVNEDWKNIQTAGFWSRWLLWNKPTIDESMKDIYDRFNLQIVKV